jgi:hypothetical protein
VTRYNLDNQKDYENLYYRLTGQGQMAKPELGDLRPLDQKPVRTDIASLMTTPINIPLWDEAGWEATLFVAYSDRPPILGIAFRNEEPARRIFEQWRARLGEVDEKEEIRLSIVEGEVGPDSKEGYFVHIGINAENVLERIRREGLHVPDKHNPFLMISRINRMYPAPESKNLQIFKQGFAQFRAFTLIPAVVSEKHGRIKPIFDLGLEKRQVYFRKVDEIEENDVDSVIFLEPDN